MEQILNWVGYTCLILAGVQLIRIIKFKVEENKKMKNEKAQRLALEEAKKKEEEHRIRVQEESKKKIQQQKQEFRSEILKQIDERDWKQKEAEKKAAQRAKLKPGLWGIAGSYADAFVSLEREILFGRAYQCNLVFPEDTRQVSRKHCSLSYDKEIEMFCLTDLWSSCGTYLGNGRKLDAGESVWLKENEEFVLGNSERFRVGMKAG